VTENEITPEEPAIIRARLLGTVFTLTGLGLVLVYSSSSVRALGFGWDMSYLAKQLQWLAIGLAGLGVMSSLPYRWLAKLWLPLLLIVFGLLIAVRAPGIGTKVNNAYRWFRFGGMSVQPSEIAKLGLVIAIAALLAGSRGSRLSFFREFLPVALVTGAAMGLVAIEPDFGTAALLGAVLGAMLIAGGARLWQLLALGSLAVPPIVYVGMTKFDHISARLNDWWSSSTTGTGYHTWMSKVALGSGGTSGMGLGEGAGKLYYLPEAHTDFIFAIAGQELGLIGTLFILAAFAFFIHEGLRLVRLAPDRFGALLAFGIVTMIGLQAIFNIAVVTGSVPPKGIALPFVSFGGSGLCVALASVGVLVSISRAAQKKIALESLCEEEPESLREAA
jgi:cell division protein FtsW